MLAAAVVAALVWPAVALGPTAQATFALSVSGNHLVDAAGQTVVLRGANTSGTEYACVQEHSIFDGGQEASATSIAAMRSWGFNAARVQLNESCWLGVQGVKPAYSGAAYRQAVVSYVDALNAAGMYVIVDLHWSSNGGKRWARRQLAMPDQNYAPAFWRSVAETFKSNPAVVFDLFNEPFPNRNSDTTAAWECVLRGSAGGTCRGFGFRAVGTQQLLDVVRGTGAANVVMAGGPQYAGDLDQWLRYEPVDPVHQLAASIHVYWRNSANPGYSPCYQAGCWSGVLAPLAAQVPVVVGEFGELDCSDTLYPPFLSFADQHGISYLAWAWFAGSCTGEPSLITNYGGSPTPYGVGYEQHLHNLGLGP